MSTKKKEKGTFPRFTASAHNLVSDNPSPVSTESFLPYPIFTSTADLRSCVVTLRLETRVSDLPAGGDLDVHDPTRRGRQIPSAGTNQVALHVRPRPSPTLAGR